MEPVLGDPAGSGEDRRSGGDPDDDVVGQHEHHSGEGGRDTETGDLDPPPGGASW